MADFGGGAGGHGLSRRTVLAGAVALPASLVLPASTLPAAASSPVVPLAVNPREAWARGLQPRGPLGVERPGDVRFLLVHHTFSRNGYTKASVPEQLRGFYRFHTGPEKRWPDIAYNFLVDRFGGVWEGRAGSLRAPVKGSATGGSQGFALLACYIGDLTRVPPSDAARRSMIRLLAELAERYRIDTRPGATTSFVSRGSNRWPAGRRVTTATIAGHRDMSRTSCPGEAAYADVRRRYPAEVTAVRLAMRAGV